MTSDSTNSSNSGNNLVHCYNKGCGQKFDPKKNSPDICQHHPGVPVFHDALKGWSCCNKKSTDFSQFLSIPGCSKSAHSNEKPVEVEKPKQPSADEIEKIIKQEVLLESRKPVEPTPRPSTDEPLIELKRTVAPSLTSTLEKLMSELTHVDKDASDTNEKLMNVPVGTPCKNSTCQVRYENETSNNKTCTYHPGVAIFHEGMKYWSCCERKTSDFDNFLNQIGCTEGSHLWFKKEAANGEKAECRYDFHQTGGFVVLTVYAKNSVPDKCTIRANRIRLDIEISFETGSKTFQKVLELFGVVKLEESCVNFFASKVEIKLKKADAINWTKLEYSAK